jgi:hypothetical protein
VTSPGPAGEHARRAAATYGAAADHYDLPALSFWDRFGAATVSRLRLAPGHGVLDLCCGAGASDIVLGSSGYRATIEALSQEQRDIVRKHVIRDLSSATVTAVRTDVVFGTAERPC